MKTTSMLSIVLIALMCIQSAGTSQSRRNSSMWKPAVSLPAYSNVWLDMNRIKMDLNNRGGLESLAQVGGAFWPDTSNYRDRVIVFDLGPWVVGKLRDTVKMGFSQWGSSYSPGPVINGQAALIAAPGDSLRYRLYKIAGGEGQNTNPDYTEWPAEWGAPVDAQGKPRLYGDQTVWTVFNNLDATAPSGWWQSHMPNPGLPLEIRQTAYEHAITGGDTNTLLANVAIIEWTIINVGEAPIESAYVSLWTDIDFNLAPDNRPAIDTVHQLGYCWQAYDDGYGPPRAVGFVWLYGPAVPSLGSTAIFRGESRANMRNLPLSSFWGIQDDSYQDESFYGPAKSMKTAWNIARGLDKMGNPILDSVTHQVTRFPYSGDPVTGTGWLCPHSSGGAGFNLFSGPFTFAPRDTQWVMAALLPSTSSDRLECVTLLRQYAATLRSMSYSELILTSASGTTPTVPSAVRLEQNYPNPFNPTTAIRYALPQRTHVVLTIFNTLGQQVASLVNETQDAGQHEVRFEATGLASGVYFYRLRAGEYAETKRLILIR